jgi:hypothetical protein
LQEPNLGKTNHHVIRFISLVDLFSPSLSDSTLFLTLTPVVVVFKVVNFRFAYSPPSRRLSITMFIIVQRIINNVDNEE